VGSSCDPTKSGKHTFAHVGSENRNRNYRPTLASGVSSQAHPQALCIKGNIDVYFVSRPPVGGIKSVLEASELLASRRLDVPRRFLMLALCKHGWRARCAVVDGTGFVCCDNYRRAEVNGRAGDPSVTPGRPYRQGRQLELLRILGSYSNSWSSVSARAESCEPSSGKNTRVVYYSISYSSTRWDTRQSNRKLKAWFAQPYTQSLLMTAGRDWVDGM